MSSWQNRIIGHGEEDAEQLGRQCVGMEIAPGYVAVGLQRMTDMGLEPRLMVDDND